MIRRALLAICWIWAITGLAALLYAAYMIWTLTAPFGAIQARIFVVTILFGCISSVASLHAILALHPERN